MGAPFSTVSRTFGFVHFDSKGPVLLKAYPPDEERDYCSQAVSVGLLPDDPGKIAQFLQELCLCRGDQENPGIAAKFFKHLSSFSGEGNRQRGDGLKWGLKWSSNP